VDVRIDYRLEGDGWAKAVVVAGNLKVEMRVSYVTDALGDLMRAVTSVSEGQPEARLTWAREPDWYRWRLDRRGENVEFSIWRYDDEPDPLDAQDGVLMLSAETTVEGISSAVSAAAHAVLDQHGVAGYKELWSTTPFPLDELVRLDVANNELAG
jgi:hypothetical protein